MKFGVAAAVVLAAGSWGTPMVQGDRCTAARDLVRETRARLQPDSSPAVFADAVLSFQRATELCPGLGDAYYFLSVIGSSLKDRRTDNWRAKAELYDSQALRKGESVFGGAKPPGTTPGSPHPLRPLGPVIRISPFVKRKLALVVGISRFKDPGINALRYTSADARAVGDALKQYSQFDYVKMLLDEEATRRGILSEIEQLAKIAEPDDLVVLYVSSHGSPENLDTAGVNYIVTHDTEVSNLYPTAYEMYDLLRDMNQRIKAARVIAFLDTCYSGGTFRELPQGWTSTSRSLTSDIGVSQDRLMEGLRAGAKNLVVDRVGSNPSANVVAQGVGRVIITSSSQAERSWEDQRIEHGYFTYFLLQALQKKGPVSVDQVYAELRLRVPEAVQRDKKQPQHPGMAQFPEHPNLYLNDRVQ